MSLKNEIMMRLYDNQMAHSSGLFQYDYGQRLIFTGVDLPTTYEVQFSNDPNGESKTVMGDSTGVSIPDEYLLSGDPVYIWVVLHETENDGETMYCGKINVTPRAKPTNKPLIPVQHND